jgi:hypothetical protein
VDRNLKDLFDAPLRPKTLFQFGEQDAAVAIIAPYACGEKSEEVEVLLDKGGTRR